jgi:type IV pilus assembly protein PilA
MFLYVHTIDEEMNMKKGFTLIELLAVIVILAIIAVIATPIVLGLINDSRRSATVRSAEFYLDAAINSIMKQNMDTSGGFNPSTCIVNTQGNISCDVSDTPIIVEINGQKPISGEFMLENGKIKDATLIFDNGTVSMNTNNQLVYNE